MSPLCKALTYGIASSLRVQSRIASVNGFGRHYHSFKMTTPSNLLFSNMSVKSTSCSPLNSQQFGIVKRHKATDAQAAEASFVEVLEREIQDEMAEMGNQLSSDQFPGFSVETDGAEVKLTKQVGNDKITVRFNVSSSLNEWPNQDASQSQNENEVVSELLSMPDFQVQISKSDTTLEMSCYFEQPDDEESPMEQSFSSEPVFNIDEIVLYQNEPKETEFSVNADLFNEDLQNSLLNFLNERGIDDQFGKNLVQFATNYEKKQYIGFMKQLKNFVSK